MEARIHSLGIDVTETLLRQTHEKLALALDRLEEDVLDIFLYLEDINGPLLGGEDKACRIIVELRRQEALIVEDIDESVDVVIDRATDRLGVFASQRVEWLRRKRRKPRPSNDSDQPADFGW